MLLVYKGKTKDVYSLEDGNFLLKFKDDMTGSGGVFDPGANTVGLTLEGAGLAGLRLSVFFFELLEKKGIPTHFISANTVDNTMIVKPAQFFGKGVEVILRYRAVGSFLRRYGLYCQENDKLDGYVEVTLKDDLRNDPLITKEGLAELNIMSFEEYDILYNLTKKSGEILKDFMLKKGIELYDIKFEFGRVGSDLHIAMIDEISGGNMRAFKDGKQISPLELEKILLED
ncbi:MAG: phosphoribosylaminoimidazolesuccinocarboxamide synthase [Tissierellales bacterium]